MARAGRRTATVEVMITTEGVVVVPPRRAGPTPERLAHGGIRLVRLFDAEGNVVMVQRSISLIERLALAGELGDEMIGMLAAAEWFCQLGEEAQLRGRMVRSQLAKPEPTDRVEIVQARIALARIYDAIGADGFNALFDVLVWDIEPRGPDRKALLRAALHALMRWHGRNAKNPAGS